MKERYEQSREDAAHFKAEPTASAPNSINAERTRIPQERLESAREIAIHNAKSATKPPASEVPAPGEEGGRGHRLKAKLYDYIVAGA